LNFFLVDSADLKPKGMALPLGSPEGMARARGRKALLLAAGLTALVDFSRVFYYPLWLQGGDEGDRVQGEEDESGGEILSTKKK
jgi:hypothetical protein